MQPEKAQQCGHHIQSSACNLIIATRPNTCERSTRVCVPFSVTSCIPTPARSSYNDAVSVMTKSLETAVTKGCDSFQTTRLALSMIGQHNGGTKKSVMFINVGRSIKYAWQGLLHRKNRYNK
jgi:hypothetical protein